MSKSKSPYTAEFSRFLLERRHQLGLTLAQLEARTGIHNARLSRWERGIGLPDRPERLVALAKGLEVPLADLYALAGIELPDQLPSLRPYLRSRYGDDLPPEALADIARYSEQVAARYGVTTGPESGEDEQPPHEQHQERRTP